MTTNIIKNNINFIKTIFLVSVFSVLIYIFPHKIVNAGFCCEGPSCSGYTVVTGQSVVTGSSVITGQSEITGYTVNAGNSFAQGTSQVVGGTYTYGSSVDTGYSANTGSSQNVGYTQSGVTTNAGYSAQTGSSVNTGSSVYTGYSANTGSSVITGRTMVAGVAMSTGRAVGTPAPVQKPFRCEPYLTTYLGCGKGDDPTEVKKLQVFLINYEGHKIAVTGKYDQATIDAVKKFQKKYEIDVLKESWGLNCTTGCTYITTRAKINDIVCNTKTDFKKIPLPDPRPKFVCEGDVTQKTSTKCSPVTNVNIVNGNVASVSSSGFNASSLKNKSQSFWKSVID